MTRTVEATIDSNGEVHLIKPLKLDREYRALVLIMDAEPGKQEVLASEHSLIEWNLPDEERACMHLQKV